MSTYGVSFTLEAGYPEAVERTRAALARRGFGVLTPGLSPVADQARERITAALATLAGVSVTTGTG
jgi:hypothetical protein